MKGFAGAVVCETRDLGIRWSYWHTLMFSDEKIDMRLVCPKNVKKDAGAEGPFSVLDKCGQQSTGMKSQKKEHGWKQVKLFCVKSEGQLD